MMQKLKVFRIRNDAKLPVRAHEGDGGLDFHYCPDKEFPFRAEKEKFDIRIAAGESVIIPTGLKVEVPFGYMLEMKNKSSVAAKEQLLVGACIIDFGYSGEVFCNLHNVGREIKTIKPGQKLCQGVLIPISLCQVEEVKDDSTMNQNSTRGEGSLGSTGKY